MLITIPAENQTFPVGSNIHKQDFVFQAIKASCCVVKKASLQDQFLEPIITQNKRGYGCESTIL